MSKYLKAAFLSLLFLTNTLSAKVEPPNYNFSLNKFDEYMPGNILPKEKQKHLTFNKNGFKTHKIYIEHIRYKFPLFVQTKDNKIVDFFARLPAYFIHDLFHQSLINKLGNQDVYKKVEEQAVYVWKNKNNLRHYYSGACSITCFPIYYAVKISGNTFGKDYIPLIEQLSN